MPGNYKRKDSFYCKAKEEGYRGRAAFKIIELDKRFKLLRPGASAVDLGCAPGGWMQYAAKVLGVKGTLIGVDIEPVAPFLPAELSSKAASPQVILGDITSEDVIKQILELATGPVDVVLSDMSPHLSGVRDRDNAGIITLVEHAHSAAQKLLKPGGAFVAKMFPSPEADALFKLIQKDFGKAQRVNLESTRKTSREIYFVFQQYRRVEYTHRK